MVGTVLYLEVGQPLKYTYDSSCLPHIERIRLFVIAVSSFTILVWPGQDSRAFPCKLQVSNTKAVHGSRPSEHQILILNVPVLHLFIVHD